MRDIFIFSAILCMVFAAFRKPQIGVLSWLWISIMNPHKESFGWIYTMPLLDIVAGATLVSALMNFKKANSTRFHPIVAMLLIFYLLTCLSTAVNFGLDQAFDKWLDFTKTMLFVMLMLLLLNKKHWIIAGLWVFILAIAFTGVKGGIFTLLTGGGVRIWGAPSTAWGDNNGVSIAMLMVTPLIFASREFFTKKLFRFGVYASAFFTFICILGTQSRGGLVGLAGVSGAYFIRSKHKLVMGVLIVFMAMGIFAFMPDSWRDRMYTIQTYEEDASASSRIIQWKYAVQLASESPVIGVGFNGRYYQPYYRKYLTGIDVNRAVHSNYFQALEEQGYLGLFIYLLTMATAVIAAQRVSGKAAHRDDLKWARSFLFYSQFSIVGYAANGLTLNLTYLDLYYYILAFIVLLISHINSELEKPSPEAAVAPELHPTDPNYIRT